MVQRVTSEFAEPVRATEPMVVASRQTSFRRRTWFTVTVAAICAIHAGLLAAFLWHDDPVTAPSAEETPVEVVAEMPKPPEPDVPEPKAQEPRKPTPPQQPEKPATSAPRAQNDETVERDSDADKSHAPKAKPDQPSPPRNAVPEQPLPQQAQDAAQDAASQAKEARAEPVKSESANPEPVKADPAKPGEAAPADAAVADKAAAPTDDASDAEALDRAVDKAPPEPPRRPAELAQAAPPKPPARPAKLAMAVPQPMPQSLPTAIDQLAGNSDLPDYVFAKPQRRKTKYKGGSEDNRYLAIVFAMVTQNQQPVLLPPGEWQVAVSFEVDGHGSLIGIDLSESSGYPQVDAAAIDAVRRAAPFPPPPSGGITGMTARMGSRQIRAAQQREAERRAAEPRGGRGRGGWPEAR